MLSDDDQKLAKILFGLLKNATSQAVVKEFLRTKGIPVSAQNWDDLYERSPSPSGLRCRTANRMRMTSDLH
ncbi:hypothetical protein LU647_11980, partial [Pseudomonas alloputida]|nr:hypothetical protein [Pseudomonas alloputida]